MAHGQNWSEGEVQQALELYLRLEFGKFHKTNPKVVGLAQKLGRTASAVALKLSNLATLDESLPQRGMANASATDRRVWAGFLADPSDVLAIYEAAQRAPQHPPYGYAERQAKYEAKQSNSPTRPAQQRVGQALFLEMIMTSYRDRCALTGLEDTQLLIASHIVGWADDPAHRLKPENGICLNALHDRAFDRHLITFDEEYRMVIAKSVPEMASAALTGKHSGKLTMPTRFLPSQDFLERHRQKFHDRLAR